MFGWYIFILTKNNGITQNIDDIEDEFPAIMERLAAFQEHNVFTGAECI